MQTQRDEIRPTGKVFDVISSGVSVRDIGDDEQN